ncbi:DUF5065 family protein [Bacillus toyonensis]
MKLGKLALVGSLALGGFTGLAALDAKPAAASEKAVQYANPYDPWGIDNTWILQYIDPMPDSYKQKLMSSYKTGYNFTLMADWNSSLALGKDQVKIFRVADDGSGELSRYKTIDYHVVAIGVTQAIWDTTITDNYLPGTYIAVSYINGKHLKSDFFTINK